MNRMTIVFLLASICCSSLSAQTQEPDIARGQIENGTYHFYLWRGEEAQTELDRIFKAFGWNLIAGKEADFKFTDGMLVDIERKPEGWLTPEEKDRINRIPKDIMSKMNSGYYYYFRPRKVIGPLDLLEMVTIGPWRATFRHAEIPSFSFYEDDMVKALLGLEEPDSRFGFHRFSTTEGFKFSSANKLPITATVRPPLPAVGMSDYPTIEFGAGMTMINALVGVATPQGFGGFYDLNNELELTTASPSTYFGVEYDGRILSIAKFWNQEVLEYNGKPHYLPDWRIKTQLDFKSSWKGRYGYIIAFFETTKGVTMETYSHEGETHFGGKIYYPFKLDRSDNWHLGLKLMGVTGNNSSMGGGIDFNHSAIPIVLGLHGSFGRNSTVMINFELDLSRPRSYNDEYLHQ